MPLFHLMQKKLFISMILLSLLLVVGCFDYLYFRNRIYPGIHLKDIKLAGKTLNEVELALDNIKIDFIGPEGRTTSKSLRKMGVIPNAQEVFINAYAYGRKSTWPSTYIERLKLAKEGTVIPFSYYLDEGLLEWGTAVLENTFNLDPINAFFEVYLSRGETQARLVPEISGYLLEQDKFILRMQQVLNDSHTSFIVKMPMEKISPDITATFFKEKGINGLVSSTSTRFDPTNTNRVHNIKLAAGYLHHYLLAPGEILSLNALIGDTTPEKGYKEAPVMVGDQLVLGHGGGICQISTTLYNAALLANLQIIERHNHHMSISYISPGRDATIVYGERDLKVRNNKDHYIFINANVEYDKLRFAFFGAPMKERVVIDTRFLSVYEPPVRYKYTPEVAPGEHEIIEGSPGYLVEVWKYVFGDEAEPVRNIVSVDSYTPYPTIMRRHSPVSWR